MRSNICWIAFILLSITNAIAQNADYSFIQYHKNHIQVADSSYLVPFYEELMEYKHQKSGKIKILQIGDSHVQAGFWGGKFRELLHNGFDQGTIERGFVFPYKMAKTNGPINYGVDFEGEWEGCRNVFTEKACGWGVSGITATTYTGGKLKIWFDNKTFPGHQHDRVDIYFVDSLKNYDVSLNCASDIIAIDTLQKANALRFYLGEVADTFWLSFLPKTPQVSPFILQGLYFGNQLEGLTFSEIGVNGAEVPSYLACPLFNDQLKAIDPDLIFISLGTNDVYSETYNDSLFYHQYDTLITNIKSVNPRAKIILTTPGDCKRYRKYTIKETQLARNTIKKLVLKHRIALWDFNEVMGGLNAMNQWYASGLTSRDKLHLNKKGYELQGELMYQALMFDFDKYYLEKNPPVVEKEKGNIDWLTFLKYDEKDPMIFTNYSFWVFFTILFMVYAFIYKKIAIRNAFLVICSFFFYYKIGEWYFFLLIFSTIVDYFLGDFIFKTTKKHLKKWGVFFSVFINLFVLCYYKYAYFFIGTVNDMVGTSFIVKDYFALFANGLTGASFNTLEILLPVGISFYTFQTISYSIDIYRGNIKPVKNIMDFAFYVSFFPQLVAGPIVRANEFVHQIYAPYRLSKNDFGRAVFLIFSGLFKKIVISDYISVNLVDRIFDNPYAYSGFENLIGVYGYAVQIYCDFSGYTDIAIGIALLLGFSLPLNFDRPYLSQNITDFWRRWHISLSNWLRDYLYIPLGGNRKGKTRTYIHLLITMLLGGLWHGASWNFVIWGGLHGVALMIHKVYVNSGKDIFKLPKFIHILITFHFVCFCWVFFRANSYHSALVIFEQIGSAFLAVNPLEVITAYSKVVTLIILAFILHWIPSSFEERVKNIYAKLNWYGVAGLATLLTVLLYQFKSAEIQPFIYFQF